MLFRVEHIHRLAPGIEGPPNRWERALILILQKLELIMPTLDETLVRVKESGDRLDSLIVYNQGIKQRLDEALAGVLNADQQAKVDAIFAEADENVGKTDAALNANVPTPPQ